MPHFNLCATRIARVEKKALTTKEKEDVLKAIESKQEKTKIQSEDVEINKLPAQEIPESTEQTEIPSNTEDVDIAFFN